MAVTNYYTVNGAILGEKTTGGSRVDYLTDALGSVTATVDQSANVLNTYRYKPYGAQLAKTGAGSDPAFRWVGSQGYRQTGKQFSDVYIRRRHYSSELGRWTTKDQLPEELLRYLYAEANPVSLIDPTGLQAKFPPSKCPERPNAWCWGGGKVPSDRKCEDMWNPDPEQGKREGGATGCDFSVGMPWIIVCAFLGDPRFECTAQHELWHSDDMYECCRRAGACMRKKTGKPLKKEECKGIFNKWLNDELVKSWFECRARKYAEMPCLWKLLRRLHCTTIEDGQEVVDVNKPAPCPEMIDHYYNVKWRMDGYCRTPGVDPSRRYPPKPCPFDTYGNPR